MAYNKEWYTDAKWTEIEAAFEAGFKAGEAGKGIKDDSRPRGELNPWWKWGWAVATGDLSYKFNS